MISFGILDRIILIMKQINYNNTGDYFCNLFKKWIQTWFFRSSISMAFACAALSEWVCDWLDVIVGQLHRGAGGRVQCEALALFYSWCHHSLKVYPPVETTDRTCYTPLWSTEIFQARFLPDTIDRWCVCVVLGGPRAPLDMCYCPPPAQ